MKLPVPSQKLFNLARAALALLLVTYAPPRLLVALAMDKGLQAWWSALRGLRFDGVTALWGGVDLLLLLGGIALGERAVRSFLEPRSRTTTNEEAEPRRILVLPLSALASPGRRPALGPGASLADTGLPQDLTLHYRLADDLAALAEYKRTSSQRKEHWTLWKWEQTLRAIHHHCRARPDGEAGPLAQVVFVVSDESLAETPMFHRLVS